jgi:pimeloyl-ACP methyl ester carboxylesterase
MPTFSPDPDVELYYRDIGSGSPIVCIHGGFMSHRVWDPLFATLPADHRLIAADLRGHGRSEAPFDSCTDDALAADLAALLDHLELEDATYVGWSLGATTGVTYLGRYDDERLSKVLLNSTGIFAGLTAEARRRTDDDDAGTGDFLDFDALKHRHRLDNPAAMWSFVDGIFTENASDRTREQFYRIAMGTPLDVVLDVLDVYATMDYGRLYDYATGIDRPVWCVQGAHDDTATLEDARYTANHVFQEAQAVTFEDSGHVPFVEEQQRFIDLVRSITEGQRST